MESAEIQKIPTDVSITGENARHQAYDSGKAPEYVKVSETHRQEMHSISQAVRRQNAGSRQPLLTTALTVTNL